MATVSSFTMILMGAIFGLTAGISPGPLLTLVIAETLRHNRKAGIRIALAPLITDLPIILVSYFIISAISRYGILLIMISLSGGIFFSYLGYETIKSRSLATDNQSQISYSLRKGIIANFVNPHPYLFWFTVGIPTAFKAYELSTTTVIFYFLLFYLMLVGSKIGIAIIVERSKTFLKKNIYGIIMKVLGAILLFFAAFFFYEAIKQLLAT